MSHAFVLPSSPLHFRCSPARSTLPRRRPVTVAKLRVAIAGGGLGGLALASALVRRDVDVRVFEQATTYKPFGGPIQVQSNALALLSAIDKNLAEQVFERGTATGDRKSGIKDGISDQWYCTFDTGAPAIRRGLPITHVIDRPRLQNIFVNFINSFAPGALRTNSRVVRYKNTEEGVEVHLENGSVFSADVLVAADGIWSNVRAQMHGENVRQSAHYSGYTCYTATCDYVMEDSRDVSYKIFLGKKQYFVCSDVGEGRVQWYAFRGVAPGSATEGAKLPALKHAFEGWSPEVVQLLEATNEPAVERRDLYDRPPTFGWTDKRVVLLGDSAHPMMPNLGQGGCMAFEDAYCLSKELAMCNSDSSAIENALRRYESERFMRTSMVQGLARMSSDLLFHYDRLASGGANVFQGWGIFWSTVGSWAIGGCMPLILDFLYVDLL